MDEADLEYLRDLMRRSDLRWQQTVARWEREAERRHREYMAHFRELQEENRAQREEMREESRAQRAALMAVLDRLTGGGGAQPAT